MDKTLHPPFPLERGTRKCHELLSYNVVYYTYIYANHTIQNTVQNTQVTPLFRYDRFINFCVQFFDTRRETQFLKVFRNHSMLTTPPTFGTSSGVLDLNSSLPVEIRKIQPYASTVETSTSQHHGRNSTEPFSKSSKFSARLFWAWRHPHSCLGFIITMVIVISFAHERKLHQLTTHLNS